MKEQSSIKMKYKGYIRHDLFTTIFNKLVDGAQGVVLQLHIVSIDRHRNSTQVLDFISHGFNTFFLFLYHK